MGARSGGKAKSAIFGWVEPWANPIRKVFESADRLSTICVRPRRIVSISLQSHQLNLLVIASFTDRIRRRSRIEREIEMNSDRLGLFRVCFTSVRIDEDLNELTDPIMV